MGSKPNWHLQPFCKLNKETSYFLWTFQSPFQNCKWLTKAKSSPLNNSSQQPFLDKPPNILAKSKGLKYWCNFTWTKKPSQKVPSTLTQLQAFPYIDYTTLTRPWQIESVHTRRTQNLKFNNYSHEHTFSFSWVREAILRH